jgi:rod shape-determining protein MreC
MPGARRTSRRRYVLLVIVLTCLTLITLDSRNGRSGALGSIGGLAHRVVSPFQTAVDHVASPVSDWWDSVSNSGDLKKRNRALEAENAKLRGKQTQAEEAIRENSDLKRFLQLHDALLVKNVTGSIIGRDPGNFDPTFTIDKGTDQGIAVDMPVIAPEGIVGKVIEVWSNGAKIQALTDPNFSVGVKTPGHGGAPATTGIASGVTNSHDLAVDFDAGTKLLRGDQIVTSPQSTLFPSGLPVGIVASLENQPGNTGVSATITPYVHLGALQYLTVLLWSPGNPGPVLPPPPTTATTTTTLPGSTTTTFPGETTTTFPGETTTTVSGTTTTTTKSGG